MKKLIVQKSLKVLDIMVDTTYKETKAKLGRPSNFLKVTQMVDRFEITPDCKSCLLLVLQKVGIHCIGKSKKNEHLSYP